MGVIPFNNMKFMSLRKMKGALFSLKLICKNLFSDLGRGEGRSRLSPEFGETRKPDLWC